VGVFSRPGRAEARPLSSRNNEHRTPSLHVGIFSSF
jgi:hypothetical protein